MRSRFMALSAAIWLVALSCAPMQMYEGNALPSHEVCVIRAPTSYPHVSLVAVDGARARAPAEILPGRRIVRAQLSDEDSDGFELKGACNISVEAVGGTELFIRGSFTPPAKRVPGPEGVPGRAARVRLWLEDSDGTRVANCEEFEMYR